MVRVDDADRLCMPESRVAPGKHPADDLGSEAFAVDRRNERPARFRYAFDGRNHVALKIMEPGLADEAP